MSKRLYGLIFCGCILQVSVFCQQPKLVIPVGHVNLVTNTQFSPDSKLVATTSDDKTIKIWDPVTGRLLKTLYGHKATITTIAFSPKAHYLFSASKEDGSNRIWNLITGEKIIVVERLAFPEVQASFSNDEKWAAVVQNESIGLIDLQTGQLMDSFKVKKVDDTYYNFSFTAFSNDGKLIAGYDYLSHSLFIWDRVANKLLKKITVHKDGYDAFNIHFSNNDKQVYILTTNNFIVADIVSGKIKFTSLPYTSAFGRPVICRDGRFLYTGGTEKLYKIVNNDTMETAEEERYTYQPTFLDLQTLKEIKIKGKRPTGEILKTQIDDAGKKMLLFTDESILVYNIVADKLLLQNRINREISQVYGSVINKSDISPDGKLILTTNKFDKLGVYNSKGKPISILKGTIEYDKNQYFSEDGNSIFTATGNKENFSWDIKAGKLSGRYDSTFKTLTDEPLFDPYKYVRFDSASQQWQIESKNKTVVLEGESGKWLQGVPSGDKKYAITFSGRDSTLKVWDAKTGKLLYKIKSRFGDYSLPVLSRDNRFMATLVSNASAQLDIMWDNMQKELDGDSVGFKTKADSPNEIRVLELATGKELLYLEDTSGTVYTSNVSFSEGSKYFSFSADNLTIWKTSNWNQQLSIKSSCVQNAPDWAFSPDGQKIIVSCNNIATVYQTGNSKLLFTLPDAVRFASYSDDGTRILTESDDKQLKIWDATNGRLFYTYYSFENGNYIVTDSYDRYDGTEGARKKLYYSCGNELIDLEQFKDQLWVPNLAERIMNGDSINAPKLSDLNICGLTPQVENQSIGTTAYHFKITPQRGGIGETVLYVNGIEAKRYKPTALKKLVGGYELHIDKSELKPFFIPGKENLVTVKAFTADNTISSRGIIIEDTVQGKSTIPPNLFAVIVGISDYKGEELDLKYAAKDAVDISAVIGNVAKKLLNTDDSEHVFIYNLTTELIRYQLPEKNSIKNLLSEIGKKATANDILLIFFAGHGIMSTRAGTDGTGEVDKKQFYFLTSDASVQTINSAIQNVGISTTELSEWMKPQNIKAQKRILIFDACNSGQAINDFVQLGKTDQGYIAARNDDKSQQIKAIDKLNEKSGLFILSASASNQSAYEMGRYSQGLLTYSLLNAIKQQPDILEDGKYLNVSRWFNAAEKTVSEISKENGARQEPQIVTNTNFNIGLVDDEVLAKIILPQEKPLFAASNFQNSDEAIADDDLELSKLINLQLSHLAARGIESKIVYVAATNSPDAYTLSGRYTLKGNAMTVSVNIKQNKIIHTKFEINGTKDKLNELAIAIAEKAAGMVK